MANYVVSEVNGINHFESRKNYIPSEQKLRELIVDHDWEKLGLLSDFSSNLSATFWAGKLPERPVIFYPGCGNDLLYFILFLERIGYSFKEADVILNDVDLVFGLIKTSLSDLGIGYVQEKSPVYENKISFYWKEQLIHLRFVSGNIFELLPHLPFFDVYFERAFRLMKDSHPEYEFKVFRKLNPEGVLISDSGYSNFPLQKLEINSQISSYGEMIVGIK